MPRRGETGGLLSQAVLRTPGPKPPDGSGRIIHSHDRAGS